MAKEKPPQEMTPEELDKALQEASSRGHEKVKEALAGPHGEHRPIVPDVVPVIAWLCMGMAGGLHLLEMMVWRHQGLPDHWRQELGKLCDRIKEKLG